EVSGRLRGILAPLILGPVFAGYFAPLVEASQAPPQSQAPQAPQASQTPQAPPNETPEDATDESAEGVAGRATEGAATEGASRGATGGAEGAGPGAAVVTLSVVAGLAALTAAPALMLSWGSSEGPRTDGKAHPTTSTSASWLPEPSAPTPPPSPTASQLSDGGNLQPRPNPSPGTPAQSPKSSHSHPGATGSPSPSPNTPQAPAPTQTPHQTPAPGTLLTNGSFESPTAGSPYTLYHAGDDIGPWRVVQNSVEVDSPTAWKAADGNQSIDLNGDLPAPASGAIAQTLDTTSGRPYTVTFYLAGNPNCAPTVKTMTVQAGKVTRSFSADITGHSPSDMGWRLETVLFTATSDRTTLRLASTTDPNSTCGPVIDNVQVHAGKPGKSGTPGKPRKSGMSGKSG
ncbi:choice-of-anchor C family protein, partial [Streptomyces sp. NPDC048506]|uniref:choice-of-anchor C family protein n=1 Tax=Streptomyces sp. NPDC048506 TaxID=3155028 RepID=UPI00343DB399